MDRDVFLAKRKQANGNLMVMLENEIMQTTRCNVSTANFCVNNILDIFNEYEKYKEEQYAKDDYEEEKER